MRTWSIDKSLSLNPISALPSNAEVLECPEQLIDTVILRNLSLITTEFLGCGSKFIFHSTEYWGPFDIGCVLDDGTFACFENKAKSFDRKGFQKFLDDINTVNSKSAEYLAHRFQHVTENHHEYVATAIRMFSSFFLRIRCDTAPQSRDLASEATKLLGTSRLDFDTNFQTNNRWLTTLQHKPALAEYINFDLSHFDTTPLLPVLVITSTCKNRVKAWIADTENIPSNALIADYQFHSDNGQYPTHLTTESPAPIVPQIAG